MREIGEILDAASSGDPSSAEELLPIAYQELRRLAASKMMQERNDHTLQPTALVHEAYMRLVGKDGSEKRFDNAGHFFAAAAEAMRRILIDHARHKKTQKKGGEFHRTTWNEEKYELKVPSEELLKVDEALGKLEAENEELATVVKLRYFAGMSIPQVAAAMGVSGSKIDRSWRAAKAWLYRELEGELGL